MSVERSSVRCKRMSSIQMRCFLDRSAACVVAMCAPLALDATIRYVSLKTRLSFFLKRLHAALDPHAPTPQLQRSRSGT